MALLGMGNPLLDVSVTCDEALLKKYGLEPQNSIRVAAWMKKVTGVDAPSTYFGCVGTDDTAAKMKECCAKDGVDPRYFEDSTTPTGQCAVLVVNNGRSLCADLKAANNYKVEHTEKEENWKIVTSAKVIYSAGFFMTVSP